jgi:hypothetical protein
MSFESRLSGSGTFSDSHLQSHTAWICGCHPLPLLVISKVAIPPFTFVLISFLRLSFPHPSLIFLSDSGLVLFSIVNVTKRGHCNFWMAWFHLLTRLAVTMGWQAGHHLRLQWISAGFVVPQHVQVRRVDFPQSAMGPIKSVAFSSCSRSMSSRRRSWRCSDISS